ncbi:MULTISPECIES: PH domain-containing protein [Enterococcus]|uniref:PH domain-containing protein n=1 Tax=Enterococcus TaxID=1350 RepID=UPI001904F980|nr:MULTISPECIES: PH domain-containing protein [Enterococcus]MBK0037962.1 PH domain-containing protein [Enterococcus sp. S52]MBK0070637.1 PH domain-containing protein [Enterococcus sp. S53]MBK0141288.1 PH domain-containing protein [Enterococcus sp. S76]MBK0144676.1 PH domain-containing protein [Enterococcus sp. S77]MEB5918151.1 PH domain-containing protein [Enterococcus innesii]
MIYEKQRLPLLCIGLYWFKNCKNFLVLAFLLVFKLFNDAPSLPIILGGILLFLLVCLIFAVLSYTRFTFQIDQTSVLVNKGLFIQKQTILPFERIQTIQENHYFYLRPFKLAEVKLESAASSNGEAEILFPALPLALIASIEASKKAAATLQQPTTQAVSGEETTHDYATVFSGEETANPPLETFTLKFKEIFLFSITDFSVFTLVLVIGYNVLDNIPNLFAYASDLQQLGLLLGAALLLGLLILFFFLAIARNLFRYYGFTVETNQQQLLITQGLFSKRHQTIPLARIQGLSVEQNLYRRIFHLSSVKLLLAAGSSSESDDTVYLFPILKEAQLTETLTRFLPEWSFQQTALVKNPRPNFWYFCRWPLLVGLLAVGISAFFFWWLALIFFVFFGSFVLSSIWRGKIQGYQFLDNHVLLCQTIRGLTKVTAYLKKNKIQDFTVTTTYWQHKKGLGKSQLTIKTEDTLTESKLFYFPLTEAEKLRRWFLS